MGGGKTSFIIPILALYTILQKNYRNDHDETKRDYNKFIYVLPEVLVKQSTNIISRYLSHVIPNSIHTFSITRISNNNHEFLNELCDFFDNITILSDTSLKSYILNAKTHRNNINLQEEKLDIERSDVFVITDEIDDVIDPMKSELNYPEEKQENYVNEHVSYISDILIEIVEEICMNDELLEKHRSIRDTRASKHIVLDSHYINTFL